jgi:hypothetical protein
MAALRAAIGSTKVSGQGWSADRHGRSALPPIHPSDLPRATMAESTAYLLGQLIEGVAGLRRDITDLRGDFDTEKDHAHESRKDVHRKIDDLGNRVGSVEGTIQLAGQVTAQTRDRIDAVNNEVSERIGGLEASLAKDIKPTVEEFKRMKLIGWSIVGVVGIGGTAFGASLIWWGEQVSQALRSLLRIP